jgi:hypothetical protein
MLTYIPLSPYFDDFLPRSLPWAMMVNNGSLRGLTWLWLNTIMIHSRSFFNAFILWYNEAVVHYCDFCHAAFHVLRGPGLKMREHRWWRHCKSFILFYNLNCSAWERAPTQGYRKEPLFHSKRRSVRDRESNPSHLRGKQQHTHPGYPLRLTILDPRHALKSRAKLVNFIGSSANPCPLRWLLICQFFTRNNLERNKRRTDTPQWDKEAN